MINEIHSTFNRRVSGRSKTTATVLRELISVHGVRHGLRVRFASCLRTSQGLRSDNLLSRGHCPPRPKAPTNVKDGRTSSEFHSERSPLVGVKNMSAAIWMLLSAGVIIAICLMQSSDLRTAGNPAALRTHVEGSHPAEGTHCPER